MLREELQLRPAAPARDGRRRWLLHDPVAGRYHRIGREVLGALEAPDERLRGELARLKLLRGGLGAETFAREEAAGRPTLGQLLVHKYLFFRVPLVRPQRFLEWLTPKAGFAFQGPFWWATAAAGALGLALAARQWDAFAATFMHFLSPAGLVGYLLALALLKALHEMGHGVAATRYGVRVPVMGVAFLVMFPVLYTDTTEAWELRSRRQRVTVDAAGMAVEIAVACAAILLWSFLPDGPARSVAFFLATTAWTMSLLVNLNPCMRFDGYYLLADSLGVSNLQDTGFRLARWRLREALFGWNDPKPDIGDAKGLERGLLLYAYSTWVYRFFLFIGIALLVHHMFPRAIGIVLFCVEIAMFIALPMWREIRVWGARRAAVLSSSRGRATLGLAAGVAVLFFAPLSARVGAPAVMGAGETLTLYAPVPATVDRARVASGERVEAGQPLLHLRSERLRHDLRMASLELASARAEFRRAQSARGAVSDLSLRREALARAETKLAGLRSLQADLDLVSPVAGRVELADGLHPARGVEARSALAHIRGEAMEVRASVRETDARRLHVGAAARVIIDGRPHAARVAHIAPHASDLLGAPLLADVNGGPLRTNGDPARLRLHTPRVAVTLKVENAVSGRDRRGSAFIAATRESAAKRVWRRIRGVLLREADF